MAGHQTHEQTSDPNDVPQIDMANHRQTYEAFLLILKIAIGAVALLLIAMAIFLV